MANDGHDWRHCPFDIVVAREDVIDIEKANHFFHGRNGCPGECREDHNHPGSIVRREDRSG